MSNRVREHAFSIELKSKKYLNQVKMLNKARDGVFIEGFLGELVKLHFVEEIMLDMEAVNGILRLDLNKGEFIQLLLKEEKCFTVK